MTFARSDRKQAMCDASRAVRRFGVRVLAASMTFLLLGLSLGLVFYVGLTDYPCFLWIAPLGANGTRCGFLHHVGESESAVVREVRVVNVKMRRHTQPRETARAAPPKIKTLFIRTNSPR